MALWLLNKIYIFIWQRGAFASEPAILVKRKERSSQIWSMDKFENKIIDMRDMYEERKALGLPLRVEEPDSDVDMVCCLLAWLVILLLLCEGYQRCIHNK